MNTVLRAALAAVCCMACGDDSMPVDAGVDSGSDTGGDSGSDTGVDSGSDTTPPGIDANFMRADADVAHALDDVLRLNHLQATGTHNSYHVRPRPDTIPDWDYSNDPLGTQLQEHGVRKFELDTSWDEDLGRWRVFHIPVIDDVTTCDLLLECLRDIRVWSDAHPGHHPIFVQIEPKSFFNADTDDAIMGAMESEILTVFPRDLIVLPDDVQGTTATLREAVTTTGWPTLGEVRGKVLFFLNCGRDRCVHYANRGVGLRDRLIFADANQDDPWASVLVMNSPSMAVRDAVAAGFIVRTRAVSMPGALDASAAELSAELDEALETGAHVISTDVPSPRPDIPFHVEMPGGSPSRCNPVTAPPECTSSAIEDPSLLSP